MQACCKHFVSNELDGWKCVKRGVSSPFPPFLPPSPPPSPCSGTDRNHIDSFVPQQDLVDSYLPSFQACVEEGKVSGIMCS